MTSGLKIRFLRPLVFNSAVLTAGTIAIVLALFALDPPLLEVIELNWLDLRFRARGTIAPAPQVVLAAIDEKSLEAEGRWPWPRSRIAALVDRLSADGARVVAFDITFAEPDAASDAALAGALERASAAVVLGYFFHITQAAVGYALDPAEIERRIRTLGDSRYPLVLYAERPPAYVPWITTYAPQTNLDAFTAAAASSGYFNVPSDADGAVRWMPLVMQSGEDLFPPLSVLAVWHYLERPRLLVRAGPYGVEGVQIGERFVPTDEAGQLLINYRGPPKSFPHYSVSDILAGRLPGGTFRDKVVVVGATAIGIGDLRTTPFGPVFPGPEIHATAIDNILTGDFLARPSWAALLDVAAIVGLGLLVGITLPWLSALAGFLVTGALLLLYVIAAYWLFVHGQIWLSMVYPLLALAATYTVLTVYRFLKEERERRRIKDAFQHYVAPDVIELVLKDPGGVQLGGHETVLTALFSDLEGFTSFSERQSPSQAIGVLSDYYAAMTEQVFAQQGTLVEYVGDELFALFGAPVAQADHARRACDTALAMRERLCALGEEWVSTGRPRLKARIGVNSGTMLVGNIGSKYRFHYSAMGDAVNLASRLPEQDLRHRDHGQPSHRRARSRTVPPSRARPGARQGPAAGASHLRAPRYRRHAAASRADENARLVRSRHERLPRSALGRSAGDLRAVPGVAPAGRTVVLDARPLRRLPQRPAAGRLGRDVRAPHQVRRSMSGMAH